MADDSEPILTKVTTMEDYKKEFSKIEEKFRTELAKCNKLALQLSSYFHDTASSMTSFKSQHDEISKKIAEYTAKV